MTDSTRLSRRGFLRRTTAGIVAGATALGAPAAGRVLGANERIGVGVIGVGGQGGRHLERLCRMQAANQGVAVVGVCDVWDKRLNAAKARAGAPGYRDYRDLLQRDDLDAVVIATPDHWHAKMTIDSMAAGKDVYCEKPMTLYWEQAKNVCACADRTGRVLQVGVQSTSEDRFWKANQLIRQGAVGKLIWSSTAYCRNIPGGDWNSPLDPDAGPANLDWDMWLGWRFGLAPKRPWDPERYFRFRKYWDYSGGVATDLLYHSLAQLEIALGPQFPVRVVANGGSHVCHEREVPDTFHVIIDYPPEPGASSGHTVCLFATQANTTDVEECIRGQEATLRFIGPGVVVQPEGPFERALLEKARDGGFPGANALTKQNDRGEEVLAALSALQQPRPDHMANFLECVRTRQQPHLNAERGYRVTVPIALSVLSFREKRVKRFDPDAQTLVA